jgi:hypothetical protein
MGDEFLDTFFASYSDVYASQKQRVSTVEVRKHLKELPLTDRLGHRNIEKIREKKSKKKKSIKSKEVNNENIDFYTDSHQFQVTKPTQLKASTQELNYTGLSTSLPVAYNEFASNAIQKDGNFLNEIKSKINNDNTYESNIQILSTLGSGKSKRKIQLDKRINYKTIIDQVNEDFHKWHTLEQRYLEHIHSLCVKLTIINPSTDDIEAAHKNQLLLLLVATRRIHYKIVETYQQSIQILQSPRLDDPSKDLQEYMHNAVSSLLHIFDFLDVEPILALTGIDSFKCNPFIVSQVGNHKLHPALVMGNDEHLYMEYFRVIHRLYINKQQHDNNSNENSYGLADNTDDQTHSAHIREGHKLTSLRVYDESINENGSDCSNEDLTSLMNSPFRNINLSTRLWWMRWKKNFGVSVKVSYHINRKKVFKLRKIFNAMQQYTWQSIRFNKLQKKYYTNLLYQVFFKWDEYRVWCRRYNAMFQRSRLRLQWNVFNILRNHSLESTQVRSFHRNQRNKRNQMVFDLLRYNFRYTSIYNKFGLRNRLRTGSSLSFWSKHLLQKTLKRWRLRCVVVNALDFVDDKIDRLRLKRAFELFARNTVSNYAKFQRLKGAATRLNASIIRIASNQVTQSKVRISTFLTKLTTIKKPVVEAPNINETKSSSPLKDDKRKLRILGAVHSSIKK